MPHIIAAIHPLFICAESAQRRLFALQSFRPEQRSEGPDHYLAIIDPTRGRRAGCAFRTDTGCSRRNALRCGRDFRLLLRRLSHCRCVARNMVRRLSSRHGRRVCGGDLSGRVENDLFRQVACGADANDRPVDIRTLSTLAQWWHRAIECEQQHRGECACKHKVSNDGHQALPRNEPRTSAKAGPPFGGPPCAEISLPLGPPCGSRDRPASRGCPNRRSDTW